jgi:predicted DNA-binding transcriptional regulator AlpA
MTEWLTNTDIAERTGLKIDTLYKYRKRNTLPEPDKYIGRTPVWKQETIDNWVSDRSTIEKEIIE